jgi:hypothetical protein
MLDAINVALSVVTTASLVAFLYLIFIATFPNQRFRFFRIFGCILDDTQRWDPMYSKSLRGRASTSERCRAYTLVTLCGVFLSIAFYTGVNQALGWVPRSFGFRDDYDDFTSYISYFSAILCVVVPGVLLEWLLNLIRTSEGWRQYREDALRWTSIASVSSASTESHSK